MLKCLFFSRTHETKAQGASKKKPSLEAERAIWIGALRTIEAISSLLHLIALAAYIYLTVLTALTSHRSSLLHLIVLVAYILLFSSLLLRSHRSRGSFISTLSSLLHLTSHRYRSFISSFSSFSPLLHLIAFVSLLHLSVCIALAFHRSYTSPLSSPEHLTVLTAQISSFP